MKKKKKKNTYPPTIKKNDRKPSFHSTQNLNRTWQGQKLHGGEAAWEVRDQALVGGANTHSNIIRGVSDPQLYHHILIWAGGQIN